MDVTGIIPIHNEKKVLARVIDSVEGQTHRPEELFLVLDACTDGSEAIAQRYPAQILRTDVRNTAAAVLAAVPRASHEVLILFDGNTLVPTDFVAGLLEVYERTHADIVEWHGGMMLLTKSTVGRYGSFSRMYLWTLEYFLRVESMGGRVVRLGGPYTRLKRSPLSRNVRYGLDYSTLSERYNLSPFFRIGTKSGWVSDLFAALGTAVGHASRGRLVWALHATAKALGRT
jgi:glycosyltransferase involved in cell wall biosynthesis